MITKFEKYNESLSNNNINFKLVETNVRSKDWGTYISEKYNIFYNDENIGYLQIIKGDNEELKNPKGDVKMLKRIINNNIWLDYIIIYEEYRDNKYSYIIFDKLFEMLKNMGYNEIYLRQINMDNFYLKLGFDNRGSSIYHKNF